jgi:hypothetical protein
MGEMTRHGLMISREYVDTFARRELKLIKTGQGRVVGVLLKEISKVLGCESQSS